MNRDILFLLHILLHHYGTIRDYLPKTFSFIKFVYEISYLFDSANLFTQIMLFFLIVGVIPGLKAPP